MKRRCIDPMTDEWQEWDEPLIDMLDRMDRERAKTLNWITTAMVLASVLICLAGYSMATRHVDQEQAALNHVEVR